MRSKLLTVMLGIAFLMGAEASTAQSLCDLDLSDLDGKAFLINSETQEFLGNISSNRLDDKSICNKFGDYGSQFSELSILNQFGKYGSRFSDFSAYNSRATFPPIIILSSSKKHLLVVSINSKQKKIHPNVLFGVLCGQR